VPVWHLRPIDQDNINDDGIGDQCKFFVENQLVNGTNMMPRLKSQAKSFTGSTKLITTIREWRGYNELAQVAWTITKKEE